MAGTDEVERIARGLIDRTLPKAQWNHRAHFAAALWLLEHPEVLARSGGMGPIIRAYNEATGVANTDTSGYHETITQASLRGASAVRAGWPGELPGRVIDTLMAGQLGDKRWPFAYWSEARLMSVEARRQ